MSVFQRLLSKVGSVVVLRGVGGLEPIMLSFTPSFKLDDIKTGV